MPSFTVFFCGTGSTSYDFQNTNYHRGELISTLAKNHAGREFADWIIIDGPGSGNLQEAKKAVPSVLYPKILGTLLGLGWQQNVKHAVAVISTKLLRGHRSDAIAKPGFFERLGQRWRRGDFLEAMLATSAKWHQCEDLANADITSPLIGPIDQINLVGWSRGGCSCIMLANALYESVLTKDIPVNIFACDPVPGLGNFDSQRVAVQKNVKNYIGVYSVDERSRGFSPVLPAGSSETKAFVTTMPGRHATLVGNAAADGNSGISVLTGPGKITRNMVEQYLTDWDTSLNERLRLSPASILKEYDDIIGQGSQYKAMHHHSYLGAEKKILGVTVGLNLTQEKWFGSGGHRKVREGNKDFSRFDKVAWLTPDEHFVNQHHRDLFRSNFPKLYGWIFASMSFSDRQLADETRRCQLQYPRTWLKLGGQLGAIKAA